jgi:hypothetical protein
METRVAAKLSFLSGGAMFLAPSFRPEFHFADGPLATIWKLPRLRSNILIAKM